MVDVHGEEVARGWSRETDDHVHAEESLLSKVPPDDPRLAGATIYSTLEPCSQRASRPVTCTQLIVARGIPRVAIAWREPSVFVYDARGYEILRDAGRLVLEMTEFADEARSVNAHLLGAGPRSV